MSVVSPPRPRCLIVEDQALVAMLVEDMVEEIGFEIVGPIASCAKALAWLENDTPALALVDYMLSDGSCVDLARELKRRGVPFAVLSGYHADGPGSHPEFDGAPWIEKPMGQDALRRVVEGLLPLATQGLPPCPSPTTSP